MNKLPFGRLGSGPPTGPTRAAGCGLLGSALVCTLRAIAVEGVGEAIGRVGADSEPSGSAIRRRGFTAKEIQGGLLKIESRYIRFDNEQSKLAREIGVTVTDRIQAIPHRQRCRYTHNHCGPQPWINRLRATNRQLRRRANHQFGAGRWTTPG